MTRTYEELGTAIDAAPATIVTRLDGERKTVLQREEEAQAAGEGELAQQLGWERGIIDLNVPEKEHYSLFRGSDFEDYSEFYQLTDDTLAYARERASETANPLLRIHHLEYVLARGPQTGREWIRTQRDLAEAYRELIDRTVSRITGEPDRVDGVYVSDWTGRLASLVAVRGLLRSQEQAEWAHWITGIARSLRAIDWQRDDGIEMQHRWPFEILEHLVAIPASEIAEADRTVALDLLQEAYDHYSAEPLADQCCPVNLSGRSCN